MPIKGLTIIGEAINDSIPSTHGLFEDNDMDGLKALVRKQDEGGAAYIDVNVGLRGPDFMAAMIREVQSVTAKPLAIDTPDAAVARAGLEAYDPERAGGVTPILNSIAPLRLEMLDLYAVQRFRPIFLVSEGCEDGQPRPNLTAQDMHTTARALLDACRERALGIPNEDVIFDPGIGPIGADTRGLTKMVIEAVKLIHEDPELTGVHMSVGLTNFTVMLPPKRPDGSPVKSALENAFLTLTMPHGLDMIIGSVKRKYALMPEGHPALVCLNDILSLEGYDCVMRVVEFYSS